MMIEYAIVCDTEKNASVEAEHFIRTLKHMGTDFKVNYKRPIEVIINFHHIYFMGEAYYERWCKGRSYIMYGVAYHSGYPIKKAEAENDE